jgi:hypothetical protein
MSSEMFKNLTLRDVLPDGLSYINGSTRIYNVKHPQGITLSDNIVTDMGVNIGDYARVLMRGFISMLLHLKYQAVRI